MAALTAQRNLTQQGNVFPGREHRVLVKANAKIFIGAIVCTDATGYGVPAATATGLVVLGVAKQQGGKFTVYDNTGGASGAIEATVERGTFGFNNSAAADTIGQANMNAQCFLVDDNTVALTNGTGTRSPAGIIRYLDLATGLVFVELTPAAAL